MAKPNQCSDPPGSTSVASSVGPPKALGESKQRISLMKESVYLLTECRNIGGCSDRTTDRTETAGGNVHRRPREIEAYHSVFRERTGKR